MSEETTDPMTEKELKKILTSHKNWLMHGKGKRADLSGADLTGADLSGADLTGAHMFGVNLTNADLTNADLNGADLSGADLTGAKLSGARLTLARLTGANLYGAEIEGQTIFSLLRRATRSDGHGFFLWHCKEGFFVKAGFRFLTIKEAKIHWKNSDETMDILNFFAASIKRVKP